jgi:hypothetical protein
MPYKPTPADAISAYVAAAAWQNNVSLNAIDSPSVTDVEEIEGGEYQIFDGNERGRFAAPIVICLYDEEADLWEVYLAHGGVLKVRAEGEDFNVVDDDE